MSEGHERTVIASVTISPDGCLVVPLVWGDGLRIFPDGVPRSRWALASSAILPGGTPGLQYRRTR